MILIDRWRGGSLGQPYDGPYTQQVFVFHTAENTDIMSDNFIGYTVYDPTKETFDEVKARIFRLYIEGRLTKGQYAG